jgi:hypothetical protein
MIAQERLLGAACPILACAVLNHVDFCMRDCSTFPCDNFSSGPYPYSREFLSMQKRRRKENLPARAPYGGVVTVPGFYWDDLIKMNLVSLCEASEAIPDPPSGLVLKALNLDIRIDMAKRCLQVNQKDGWKSFDDPYLELMTLVYLLNVKHNGVQGEMVGVQDLKDAHFFQGPHALRKNSILARFGEHPEELKLAGERLGGSILDIADAAICLRPFPKIPIYYVLWTGDEEFSANLSILFDKSIERHLSADAIWGVVAWVSDTLINA